MYLAKNIIVGLAMPAPAALISRSTFFADNETKKGEVNAIQTKQDQKSDTFQADDWAKNFRIREEYETKRERVVEFLEPFADM